MRLALCLISSGDLFACFGVCGNNIEKGVRGSNLTQTVSHTELPA